ncbi:MAG: cysteine desulfurase family protein [Deltaproteobacteria bacterium]
MDPTDAPIYLDHNATTPLLPDVVDAMIPYLREHFGNPSSGHVYGRRAHAAVEAARAQVAALIECEPEQVVFTSGGTEANNLAIRGVAGAVASRRHVVTTVIEHPATLAPCAWLAANGWRVERVRVDAHGVVDLAAATRALSDDTLLLTVIHANNETGVIQPVADLARAAHAQGALVHTDAAQSIGKVAVHVDALGVDLLSIAGHKLYAPKGVGALYVRRGTPIEPFVRGAGHERGLRPGTENVASIVGLGVACAVARHDLDATASRVRALRDDLWSRLRAGVPALALNGDEQRRLPNTLNVRFPGASGAALLAAAPGVAASTGSACHDGNETASSVILAMGVSPGEAVGSVRLTLGRGTTALDIARASEELVRAWRSLRQG